LYFSLRCRGLLSAFLTTITVGLFTPVMLPPIVEMIVPGGSPGTGMRRSIGAAFVELLIGLICWLLLRERLKQRAFPLERADA
jgi:hypothetical protein